MVAPISRYRFRLAYVVVPVHPSTARLAIPAGLSVTSLARERERERERERKSTEPAFDKCGVQLVASLCGLSVSPLSRERERERERERNKKETGARLAND